MKNLDHAAQQNHNLPAGKSEVFRIWWPLALTWIMMAIESPFISALIARQAEPVINLAAFGVAHAVGFLMEAPVIMLMAAAVRLVRDQTSFRQLWRFTMLLNIGVSVGMLMLIATPLYAIFAAQFLGLDEQVAETTRRACLFLLPWPAMIGYRRFYQGILIHVGRSRAVAIGTVVRLLSLTGSAFILYRLQILDGASMGALCLSIGVSMEALAVRFLVHPYLVEIRQSQAQAESQQMNLAWISRFYFPLAMTGVLGLVAQPLVTLAMNRARFPLESLAVLPVVNGLIFFFRAIPLSYQETIISLLGKGEHYRQALRNFAWLLAISLSLLLITITLTPLADLWLNGVAGLDENLANFAKLPLQILIPTPVLTLVLCWHRSRLIHLNHTSPITSASSLELAGIACILALAIGVFDLVGAVAASVALMGGRLLTIGYLQRKMQAFNTSSS
ncbi:MAG: hypothetical protein ACOH5I_09340 [Oligoflexus sp.]